MATSLKEAYEKTSEFSAFYTGGDIQWTTDGTCFLCLCNGAINVLDMNSTSTVSIIGQTEKDTEDDPIHTFQMSHNNEIVASAHKSGLIKLWDRISGQQQKCWRSGHKGNVARLTFNLLDENLASGGSEGSIRLWDLAHNTCVSTLGGAIGVFSVLKYHPNSLIYGAADDTKIRSWNPKTGKEVAVYSGHFSKVTSLEFTSEGDFMVSSGRDRVLILWSLSENKALRTLPVYETIESMVLLPPVFTIPHFNKKLDTEGIYVACAGEKGVVKVWNVQMSRLMFEQKNSLVSAASTDGSSAITHLLFNENCNLLSVVSCDQNIIIHSLETFECIKQIVGFTDEITDIIFVGKDETHIVMATNSCDLKYYELETMNCKLIKGHTDIVLTLASFPKKPEIFISGGKDNTVKVWCCNINNDIICIATGNRHTESVGCLYASQTSLDYFVSVSQDSCLKMWNMPKDLETSNQTLKSSYTEQAHKVEINSVVVAPNDKMIATCSHDKTVKLWTESLTLIGMLKGHRRGVWCVRFSPVDQVAVTSSVDCSIKLWSIGDLSCLKTFDGHDSSVLRIEFLSRGQQIISCGADGFVKLWNLKSSECKQTLENHNDKVWAIAINKSESIIITGGSDSKVIKMKDVTLEQRARKAREREELILHEQELMNLLHDKEMIKALKLAIRLERPQTVLKVINEVLKSGSDKLRETLQKINETQKVSLLKFASEWNTHNKNCQASQIVFHILMPEIISGSLQFPGLYKFIEGVVPYSERNFDRLTNLLIDLQYTTYTVHCMQPYAGKK